MIRRVVCMAAGLFVGIGDPAAVRAGESDDLAALAKKIGGKFEDYQALGRSAMEFPATATDADLVALLAIKPKKLWSLDLTPSTRLTDAGLQKITDLPGLAHLKLPRGATDKALKDLPARVPSVSSLHLPNTAVTAAGLASLAGARELVYIDLSYAPVKDDCWKELAKLPALKSVRFYHNPVTGAGVKQLARLTKLEELSFYEAPVTDKALAELSEVKTLRKLSVQKAAITDKGLAQLTGLNNLQELFIDNNRQLTDKGLESVAKLSGLTWLSVRETGVTDAGLRHIAKLSKLKTLYANGTRITEAGVKRLKKELPDCDVSR